MRACGIDLETHPETAHDRFLHQPRGAAARLRAGHDPRRFHHRRLVRDLGPHDLDRRPHAPARPRAMSSIFRGIKNPIGLKCGPSLKPDDLLKLIDVLNPDNEPGRLTLIGRFGADKVGDHLPALIRAVQARRPQRRVVVRSDARQHDHGDERLQDPAVRPILTEVKNFFAVHRAEGTHAGGVHLEMTGQERHRMHRRRARHHRCGSQRPLPHGLRSAPQCRAVAGAGLPGRRTAQARARRPGPAGGRGGGIGQLA